MTGAGLKRWGRALAVKSCVDSLGGGSGACWDALRFAGRDSCSLDGSLSKESKALSRELFAGLLCKSMETRGIGLK